MITQIVVDIALRATRLFCFNIIIIRMIFVRPSAYRFRKIPMTSLEALQAEFNGLKEQFGAEGGANNLTLNQFCLLPEQTYNAVVTKVSILQQGRLGEIRQLARNQGKFFNSRRILR